MGIKTQLSIETTVCSDEIDVRNHYARPHEGQTAFVTLFVKGVGLYLLSFGNGIYDEDTDNSTWNTLMFERSVCMHGTDDYDMYPDDYHLSKLNKIVEVERHGLNFIFACHLDERLMVARFFLTAICDVSHHGVLKPKYPLDGSSNTDFRDFHRYEFSPIYELTHPLQVDSLQFVGLQGPFFLDFLREDVVEYVRALNEQGYTASCKL